jgi:hypothetical protein
MKNLVIYEFFQDDELTDWTKDLFDLTTDIDLVFVTSEHRQDLLDSFLGTLKLLEIDYRIPDLESPEAPPGGYSPKIKIVIDGKFTPRSLYIKLPPSKKDAEVMAKAKIWVGDENKNAICCGWNNTDGFFTEISITESLETEEELTGWTKDLFGITSSLSLVFENEQAIMFKDSAKKIQSYFEKVLLENGIGFKFKELFLSQPIAKHIFLDYEIDGQLGSKYLANLFPQKSTVHGEVANFPIRLSTNADKDGGFEFLYWNDSVGMFSEKETTK